MAGLLLSWMYQFHLITGACWAGPTLSHNRCAGEEQHRGAGLSLSTYAQLEAKLIGPHMGYAEP